MASPMKATGDPLRAIALSVTLAAVAAMAGACGSSGGDGSRARGDAGDGAAQADAGVGGTAGAGGAGTAGSPSGGTGGVGLPPVICNGETCTVPDTSNGLQAYACCVSDTNACGVRVPLSATCFAHRLPGGIDPACGPYELPGKITLPGCCGPKGCGALGLFGDLGCLPNADLGLPAKACLYSEDGGGAPAGDAAAD